MRLLRILSPSLRGLLTHRARTLLAVAGVAVGVAAVQVLTGVGEGAQAELVAGMTAQGARLLVVRPALVRRLVARKQVQGRVPTLLPSDVEALSELDAVGEVAPGLDGKLRVRSSSATTSALVLGTSPSFPRIRGFRVARGAFFSAEHDRGAERVVVLGARVEAALFPGEDPVGRSVRVGGAPFEVVGTLEAQGVTADGADVDAQVYVPTRTALRRLFNAPALGLAFVEVRDGVSHDRAEAEIRGLLRERHRLGDDRPDDFTIQDPARAGDARRKVVQAVTAFVSGLAAISLLVGGTGILALMLLSVRERTPEIGLRRAVGARPGDVLLQFLAEAVALSAAGGLLGVTAGFAGAWALAGATGWPVRVPPWAAATGVAVSAVIGVVFGAWPARQASRLAPVVALARS